MFFIGIDVSKAKLDCSLLLDVASSKRRAKMVANSKTGISDLLAWCAKQQVPVHELHAILEGTTQSIKQKPPQSLQVSA